MLCLQCILVLSLSVCSLPMCRFLLPLDDIPCTPLMDQQRVAAELGIQWAAAASQQAQLAAACRPVTCVAQHAESQFDIDSAASHWDVLELLLTIKMLEKSCLVRHDRCSAPTASCNTLGGTCAVPASCLRTWSIQKRL